MGQREHTLVIGAGLIGLCSAHYLTEAGLRVTVVEREADVALGTSRQNAGLLTPSLPVPWNSPRVLSAALMSIGQSNRPFRLHAGALHHYLRWGMHLLRHSTPARSQAATLANLELAQYSLAEMQRLRSGFDIDYPGARCGSMQIFRDAGDFENAAREADRLHNAGLAVEHLDPGSAVAREPALADTSADIAGAIYFPEDETGDAYAFCQSLKESLESRGVTFLFGESVDTVEHRHGAVRGIRSRGRLIPAQRVVMAAGVWTPRIPGFRRLAIRPVKGYSLSVPLDPATTIPHIPIIDEGRDRHVALTPLGAGLRLACAAELAGFDDAIDVARIDQLWRAFSEIFPSIADGVERRATRPWCGLRPVSADGVPYIGPARLDGLYLNTGHGRLGWTQAAGSGALLAQLVCGREPAIAADPFAAGR